MGQRFNCSIAQLSLIWCPIFLIELGSANSLSLMWAFHLRAPIISLSPPKFLLNYGGLHHPPTSWGFLFHCFLLALRVKVPFIHSLIDHAPLSGSPIPLPLPPLLPHISSLYLPGSLFQPQMWFLSSLFHVGLRCPHLGTSNYWPFCLLWTVCSVLLSFYCNSSNIEIGKNIFSKLTSIRKLIFKVSKELKKPISKAFNISVTNGVQN